MKDKANRACVRQDEMDQCWKNLAEKIEGEVLDKYKIEDSTSEVFEGRGAPLEWRRVRRSQKYIMSKWTEDCWARSFAFVQRVQLAATATQAGGVGGRRREQQQRMKIMKEWTLLADGGLLSCWRADCENAWEDTMQKWYEWLEKSQKEDDKRKVEELHQHNVAQMITIPPETNSNAFVCFWN